MAHVSWAQFLGGAVVAALMSCAVVPSVAQMRFAEDKKITAQQFERALQDTRNDIKKQQQSRTSGAGNQNVIDICKKNPSLPQCK